MLFDEFVIWDSTFSTVRGLPLPSVLKMMQPDARLLVTVRDPVDVAYSAYNHFGIFEGNVKGPEHYEAFIGNLTESWLEEKCHPGNYKTCLPEEYRSFGSYVARPMYSTYIRKWLESFDCEGLHVFDVSAEGSKSVANLYRFMNAEDNKLAKKVTASVSHIKKSNASNTDEKDKKKARSNELNKSSYS